MNRVCRWVTGLVLFLAGTGGVFAQNVVVVENDGKPCLVIGATGAIPRIEYNGKATTIHATRFALKPVAEFLPFFVAVHGMEVGSSYASAGGSAINNDLSFRARFEAGNRLEDVFILLDLDTSHGRIFFLHEIGELRPHESTPVDLVVPLLEPLGSGSFQFHLFSGGGELLHSNIPPGIREKALNRMVAKRIVGRPDGEPQPFVGPVPEYPPSLRSANLKGEAIVSFTIRARGDTVDPVVKSATNPAFGESAVAAVRLWRFFPKIRNGQAVDTRVDMPFVFDPPETVAGK